MRTIVTHGVMLVLMLTSCGAAAAGKDTTRYGVGANVAHLSVDDPEGSTDSTPVTYLSGVMTTAVDRNDPSVRLWYELKYRSFDLKPSQGEIGQDVASLGISATLQKAWGARAVGAYWVGLGAGLSLDDYQDRHTVDSDGFVAQRFKDRSEAMLEILLNTGFNLKPTPGGYYLGLNFNYHYPAGDGIKGIGATAFVLW